MPKYYYESADTTVIISADNEDDADTKLAEIVKEPNTFDLAHKVE